MWITKDPPPTPTCHLDYTVNHGLRIPPEHDHYNMNRHYPSYDRHQPTQQTLGPGQPTHQLLRYCLRQVWGASSPCPTCQGNLTWRRRVKVGHEMGDSADGRLN